MIHVDNNILNKVPLRLICKVLLDVQDSVVIGPIGIDEDPKTNCWLAVAAAHAPKITEQEKFPV